jgi:hypothetical protein
MSYQGSPVPLPRMPNACRMSGRYELMVLSAAARPVVTRCGRVRGPKTASVTAPTSHAPAMKKKTLRYPTPV